MYLLHVISSMDPRSGGPCQGIRNVAPFLERLGVHTEVVCMDELDGPDMISWYSDGFPIYALGRGKTSFQYSRALSAWLMRNLCHYDMVVVNGLWQHHNYAVYQAVKKLRSCVESVPKVIIMPHGMLDPYFQKAEGRKIKALRNEIVWRLTERKAVNAADALFFTCEEEQRLAATTFNDYHPHKTVCVGFGIQSPPDYTPQMRDAFYAQCPGVKEKPYWLFLSRIHEKKGVGLLINVYKRMADLYHSLPALVIAGHVGSDYADAMMKLAAGHPRIHFPGMLKGDAKWGAFYQCDGFILPSYQENFGIAIVEAMACSKPVLITRNVNIWKEIDAGGGGIIMDSATEAALEHALCKLHLLDETQRKEMGQNAKHIFKARYNAPSYANNFFRYLLELL